MSDDTRPRVIADDDPRLPTMADVEAIVTRLGRSQPWSWGDLNAIAREAARHALTQSPSLTNAEKRLWARNGATWCRARADATGQWPYDWEIDAWAAGEWPDDPPPPVEYTLGGTRWRIDRGSLQVLDAGNAWNDVSDDERAALKALAANL